jgi:hypothetical protein
MVARNTRYRFQRELIREERNRRLMIIGGALLAVVVIAVIVDVVVYMAIEAVVGAVT